MSRSGPQTAFVDVFLILLRDEGRKALFGLRGPAVFAAYRWNLQSGKAEPDEDALSAVIRETYEETGVQQIDAMRGGLPGEVLGALHRRFDIAQELWGLTRTDPQHSAHAAIVASTKRRAHAIGSELGV